MSEIVIKSRTAGRVRLKSKSFTEATLEKLTSLLDAEVSHVRQNPKCKSLIVFFDEQKISLEEILSCANSVVVSKPPVCCEQNQSCSGTSCGSCAVKKGDFKRSVAIFGGLSVYAAASFFGVAFSPLISWGVTLFAAIPLLKDACHDIKNKKFTLQTFLSFSLIVATFLGEIETAFEVIYILRGGTLLEEYASNKSKEKIRELLESDVKKAYVLIDGVELECDLDEINIGDIVAVRSGEKIPVDGVIVDGKAEISEALINGRSEPEFKQNGDRVYANTLLEKGRVLIKVDAIGKDTYLSKIISQVEFALLSRSESEKMADKLASRLLNLGTALTIGTYLITGSLLRAFSVMIVMSCPCSTILAASTAISAGIARGAKDGILIKGGEYLEKVSESDVACFDKTGTLTTGKPQIVNVHTEDKVSVKELFYTACLAEYQNNHPIALSIINHAKTYEITIDKTQKSELLPGLGARLKDGKDTILVGNATLFKKQKISLAKYKTQELEYTNEGKTVVYVSKNRKILGYLAFEHEARDGAQNVVRELKKRGVKQVVLLTGDDERVAHAFSKKYGFDEVYANVMPEKKAQIVEKYKKDNECVAMIGDGINDTIAMSKADIGISFASGGSEAAVEVSDIAITKNDIQDVLKLYDLSQNAKKIVEQNYWIGTSTNLLGVGLAAIGLLSPAAAGGIHIAHTVGIMANASRIALSKKE